LLTRNSAIADKPARRVYTSVKVTKHSTVPYVRYSFLLCNSNFAFKTRRFYDIRLQKCRGIIRWIVHVYSFLLVFFSNFLPKTHRFWHIRFVSIHWPWNPG